MAALLKAVRLNIWEGRQGAPQVDAPAGIAKKERSHMKQQIERSKPHI